MKFRWLFFRDPSGGVPDLFAGRRISWSFNTRVAIRAACDILGLEPGDEVLAPAYNCGSELDPFLHAGVDVTLYPVERNLRACPERISALITPRTRAIYVTHYFGILQPDLTEIRKLCDAHGLRLIEDCALSLLSGAHPAEGFVGDVSVFCFYKFFPVLQGGALVINADDLPDVDPFHRSAPGVYVAKGLLRPVLGPLVRAVKGSTGRQQQGDDPTQPLPAAGQNDPDLPDMPHHYYFDPGLQNRKISAFSARSIKAFDVADAIDARRQHWRLYRELLDGMAGVEVLLPDLDRDTSPLNMPLLVQDRDRVVSALQAQEISATAWWSGYHGALDWRGQSEAAFLKDHVLSLPAHQYLTAAHIRHIVDRLRDLV